MGAKTRRKYGTTSTITSTTTIPSGMDIGKIQNITQGLASHCFNMLHNRVLPQNRDNAMTICDYISSTKYELNLSDNYREDVIILLAKFSIFFRNALVSKQISREDLLSFLDSYRKLEASDPIHKWIGTYNIVRIHLMRFFRWLYYPDVHPSKDRPKPPPIENIPQLKRKEVSIYKPTDLWTDEDDSLFLKYCPNSRDKCYHAMARDSAAALTLGRSQDLCWITKVEQVELTPKKSGKVGKTMISSTILNKYISPEIINAVEWFDNFEMGKVRRVGGRSLFQITSDTRTHITANNLYHPSNMETEEDVIYLH